MASEVVNYIAYAFECHLQWYTQFYARFGRLKRTGT